MPRCALQQMRRIVSPREAYRYWADSFDEGTPILALESRQLLPVLPEVAGRGFIDVGCGTGRWLGWAVDRGAHAVGVDLSIEMLGVASRKTGLSGRIVQADASATPFRDACADVVLSALVIGHMRPVSRAMAELARIAAPGARVIVTDFHPDALRRGWKRTFKRGADTIEMESEPYSISELAHVDLALEEFRELPFGEQERHFFEAAGKGAWFDEMRERPAILIASYRRRG
jgi:malonyl-CoA O-methyltransferase